METNTPRPIDVELVPHDPRWAAMVQDEAAALAVALGGVLQTVHHIGSTAIPGIAAKPILDLMPVVNRLSVLDERRGAIEAFGYRWWGENGLPGRRYATSSDPVSGRRRIHLHCYTAGSAEIERHLAFRDYLLERPGIAAAYDREKARCRDRHADDSHAYADCKHAWIQRIEAEALARYRR